MNDTQARQAMLAEVYRLIDETRAEYRLHPHPGDYRSDEEQATIDGAHEALDSLKRRLEGLTGGASSVRTD